MVYKQELKIFFTVWLVILFISFYNLTNSYYKKFNFTNSLSYEIQVLSVLKDYNIDNYFDDITLQDNVLKALVKPSIWQDLDDKQKDYIEGILNKECKKNKQKCLKVDILNIK